MTSDQLERALAKEIAAEFQGDFELLMDELGDPPDLDKLPADFWDNVSKGLRAAIIPLLVSLYITQAETLMTSVGIGVDVALINTAAINWANQHAFGMVGGITDRTLSVLRSGLDSYFRDGLNIDQLSDLIAPAFSPARARRIAITETTRVTVESERELVKQLMRDNPNIIMTPFWETARTGNVCDLCDKKDGKEITDGVFPPLHPNCKCNIRWEMSVRE